MGIRFLPRHGTAVIRPFPIQLLMARPVAAQRGRLLDGEHIGSVCPPHQQKGAQRPAVQRLTGLCGRMASAGEDANGNLILQQPGVPPFQEGNHVLQTNVKPPGLLSGVLAGNDAVFQ